MDCPPQASPICGQELAEKNHFSRFTPFGPPTPGITRNTTSALHVNKPYREHSEDAKKFEFHGSKAIGCFYLLHYEKKIIIRRYQQSMSCQGEEDPSDRGLNYHSDVAPLDPKLSVDLVDIKHLLYAAIPLDQVEQRASVNVYLASLHSTVAALRSSQALPLRT
jgi:hypothetical protein